MDVEGGEKGLANSVVGVSKGSTRKRVEGLAALTGE